MERIARSAARAGTSKHWRGHASIPKRACRSEALGSNSTPGISTRSRSTTASIACPSAGDASRNGATQAPPGFCYAVKANRFLTQAKKLKDCEEPLARMMAPFRHARRPSSGRSSTSCRRASGSISSGWRSFLTLMPEGRDQRLRISRRRAGTRRRPSRCSIAMAPPSASTTWQARRRERIAVGPIAYVRFHGAGGKYWGRYSDEACCPGPTGWSSRRSADARSGPISTTTSHGRTPIARTPQSAASSA